LIFNSDQEKKKHPIGNRSVQNYHRSTGLEGLYISCGGPKQRLPSKLYTHKKTPNPTSTKTGLNWMKSFEEQDSNKGAQQSFKPVKLEKEEEARTSNSRV